MKWIKEYLDIRFDKHKKDWDTVIAICGNVGIGKSNLGLAMLEYWQELNNGVCKPEDIKHMCLTKEDFIKDLSDCKKNEMTIFDEAGEVTSRRSMSDFNVLLMKAYQVIRADNIFTLLILPDIWYLDGYFRYTRVKALFYVYQRGKVAVWFGERLRKLLKLNQFEAVKSYRLVKPNFRDNFNIYKGVMAEEYSKLKARKTTETRRNLIKEISGKGKIPQLEENIIKSELKPKIKAQLLGVSERTYFNRQRRLKEAENILTNK